MEPLPFLMMLPRPAEQTRLQGRPPSPFRRGEFTIDFLSQNYISDALTLSFPIWFSRLY
jgi:hypothetical protein